MNERSDDGGFNLLRGRFHRKTAAVRSRGPSSNQNGAASNGQSMQGGR